MSDTTSRVKSLNVSKKEYKDFKDLRTYIGNFQREYGTEKYKNSNSFYSLIRDSYLGEKLGFSVPNIGKHGWDCSTPGSDPKYLECKSIGIETKIWSAGFEDMTLNRVEDFNNDKVFMALGISRFIDDIPFAAFGQIKSLYEPLKEKVTKNVQKFKNKIANKDTSGVFRVMPSFVLSKLVSDYGFYIVCIDSTKKEVKELIKGISPRIYNKIPDDRYVSVSEIRSIFNI